MDEVKHFTRDFLCGGVAGVATGMVIATPEFLKVKIQTTAKEQLRSTLTSRKTWLMAVRNTPFFSCMFAQVCAIEFSVNKRIEAHYGKFAGVVAGATSGALFLVAADHTMYTRDRLQVSALEALKKIRPERLLTGFWPMFMREAIFLTCVMHAGPFTGKWLKARSEFGERSDEWYQRAGWIIAGMPMAVISQPFDFLARQMQMHLAKTGETPRIIPLVSQMLAERRIISGVAPRILLVPLVSVMAGSVFEKTRKLFQ